MLMEGQHIWLLWLHRHWARIPIATKPAWFACTMRARERRTRFLGDPSRKQTPWIRGAGCADPCQVREQCSGPAARLPDGAIPLKLTNAGDGYAMASVMR